MTFPKRYVSTIEEDFKAIGLVLKNKPVTESVTPEEPEDDAEGEKGGEDPKDDKELAKDEAVTPEEPEGDAEGEEGGEDPKDDKELAKDEAVMAERGPIAQKLVRNGGQLVKKRVARHLTPAEKAKKARENKKFRSSPQGRRLALGLKSGVGKAKMAALRAARKHESVSTMEQISTALAEARSAMEESETVEEGFNSVDAIKGFAQICLISDRLSSEFSHFAESQGIEEFSDLSTMFLNLSEEAADSAEGMLELAESDNDVNEEAVETDFAAMTAALSEGLEIYADLIESVPTASMTSDEDAKGDVGHEGSDDELATDESKDGPDQDKAAVGLGMPKDAEDGEDDKNDDADDNDGDDDDHEGEEGPKDEKK